MESPWNIDKMEFKSMRISPNDFLSLFGLAVSGLAFVIDVVYVKTIIPKCTSGEFVSLWPFVLTLPALLVPLNSPKPIYNILGFILLIVHVALLKGGYQELQIRVSALEKENDGRNVGSD